MEIIIKDLSIYGYHGVLDVEKQKGQIFNLDVSYWIYQDAEMKDFLGNTVDYSIICQFCEDFLSSKRYDLIELCAEELTKSILDDFDLIEEVEVTVKKPWVPMDRRYGQVVVKQKRKKSIAYISLGSNIGDRQENIENAIQLLKEKKISITKSSSYYETKPVGYVEQPDFINAVVEVKTYYSSFELLQILLGIEERMHRIRIKKWGPRIIDLDLLLYADEVHNSDKLVLPHPEMHKRLFVLEPLLEIAPKLSHPIIGGALEDMRQLLRGEDNNE